MTALCETAYWCKYCTNNIGKQCVKDVPWYASSVNCKYWSETQCQQPVKRRRVNWNKDVLVEVI